MRFGCCLNMVASGADGTGIEHIEMLAEAGYDYVELPLAEMMLLSEMDFKALQTRVAQSGLRCEVCNNFFPVSMRLTGAQVDEESTIAYVEKALARAHALGAEHVVFGSGQAKHVPEGFPMEKGYHQVVALLKRVGPIARKNDIVIVIEPLRKAECNLINTFAEGCKLAADVADENIKVLVDFYHLYEENEPIQHIVAMGRENLRHVHFANPEGRVYPEARKPEYLPFFNALKEIGYNRRLSCEAYTSNFNEISLKTLALLKTL